MNKKKQKFEFESDEKKKAYLDGIIAFFKTERNEEIGYIAAESIFDYFVQTFGEEIYQKALNDAKKLLKEKIEDLDIELDLLIDK